MLLNEANEQEIRKTVEQILSRRDFQHKEKNTIAQMNNQIWNGSAGFLKTANLKGSPGSIPISSVKMWSSF